MHFNRFDLNLLVALDALLDEKSVTRAAERLFITQPAMSGSLQRLRERFNDPLLVRAGRGMELTRRAQALAGPVREVLLRIESTLDNEPEFDPESVQRTFSLAVSDYVAAVLIPELMREMAEEAPGIRLNLVTIGDQALDDLKNGRIDMLIRALADPLHDARTLTDDIVTGELFHDRWVCAADAAHPDLGDPQQGFELTLDQYLRLPHLALNLGRNSPLIEEIARAQMSLDIDIRATAPNFISLVMMLPGSRHMVMLPKRLATLLGHYIPLILLTPPLHISPLQERLIWHIRHESDPGHNWLRAKLGAIAGRLSSG
jgi:LysR family transcriptional regulator, nod-box dependent transcriptional activator